MPTDEQIAVLRDIENSIVFDDEKNGLLNEMIVAGYVHKNGDLFEITPAGEKVLLDHGAGLNEP